MRITPREAGTGLLSESLPWVHLGTRKDGGTKAAYPLGPLTAILSRGTKLLLLGEQSFFWAPLFHHWTIISYHHWIIIETHYTIWAYIVLYKTWMLVLIQYMHTFSEMLGNFKHPSTGSQAQVRCTSPLIGAAICGANWPPSKRTLNRYLKEQKQNGGWVFPHDGNSVACMVCRELCKGEVYKLKDLSLWAKPIPDKRSRQSKNFALSHKPSCCSQLLDRECSLSLQMKHLCLYKHETSTAPVKWARSLGSSYFPCSAVRPLIFFSFWLFIYILFICSGALFFMLPRPQNTHSS